MSSRKAGVMCLLATAAGWGINWPVIKVLLQEWPPLFARGLSGIIAGTAMLALAAARGERLRVRTEEIPRLLVAAFTNVFAWMGFASLAMLWLTVSECALLVYTMPLWTTLFAWPALGERPDGRGFVALALGLAGVWTLLAGAQLGQGAAQIWGVVLSLGSAVCFALGAVLNRKPLTLGAFATTGWQVALGCVPLFAIGLLFENPDMDNITGKGLAAFIYMTLVPMGLCYITWFAALSRLPATAASTGMLIVPVLGIVLAGLTLGEPLGLREWAAMLLTLGGVALALYKPRVQAPAALD